MQTDRYISPLSTRYASAEMQYLFSQDFKFRTWRRLWIALARAEKTLGLAITDEQIAELEAHRDDINYAEAEAREREVRHDVMSHAYAYGLQPEPAPCTPESLIPGFSWAKVPKQDVCLPEGQY